MREMTKAQFPACSAIEGKSPPLLAGHCHDARSVRRGRGERRCLHPAATYADPEPDADTDANPRLRLDHGSGSGDDACWLSRASD